MKLHVNMPDYEKGADLEVMYVGPVKNGETVELTESQVASMREAGFSVPDDDGATVDLYKEAEQPAKGDLKTTELPGIEEIAEQERKKNSRKGSRTSSNQEGDK